MCCVYACVMCVCTRCVCAIQLCNTTIWSSIYLYMGWLRLVGSLKLQVSFAKEPYKRDNILQKRPLILRSLQIVATPYTLQMVHMIIHRMTYGRPRSVLEVGFRPLCPPFVYFVPLSRTKPAFWISTRTAPGPISQVLLMPGSTPSIFQEAFRAGHHMSIFRV